MRTLSEWYNAYGESHKNPINKKIHYICVPAIYFAIVGLFMSIPNHWLADTLHFQNPYLTHWGSVLVILILIFYWRLSVTTALRILLLSVVSIVLNVLISSYFSLFYFNITLFIIAWIGQFYGHHIEGKKPSFFDDIQFLLIGPAWVMDNLFAKK